MTDDGRLTVLARVAIADRHRQLDELVRLIVGLLIAGVGLLITVGVPIGRLPGDFTLRRGNFSFYFPLATSIIASIVW